MRLIDADKAQEEFCGRCAFKSDGGCSKCRFYGFIDRQPTVDPVKHGHWLEMQQECKILYGIGHYCSLCKGIAPHIRDGREYLADWCPECGAQMDDKAD